jgi:hypothetical protein
MRNMLENHFVIFNEDINAYAKWDNTTLDYTNVQNNFNQINYPIQRDVEVISVMAAASGTTPQANIVYKPIGPYLSGIVRLFDPSLSVDRIDAQNVFCPDGGCDTTLKIIQGGITKYVMLPMSLDSSLSETDVNSFSTRAVNLLASDGEISSIELLETPNVEDVGLPTDPVVLSSWSNGTLSISSQEAIKCIKLYKTRSNALSVKGLDCFNGNVRLKVISVTGQELFEMELDPKESLEVTMPNISKGVYFVNIVSRETVFMKKIIL